MNNKKIFISIFWVVLGLVLFILSVCEIIESNYFAGMGSAFIAIGVLQILGYIRCKKDENYRKKVSIKQNDERFKYLQMQSWVIVSKITVLFLAITSIVCYCLHQALLQEFALYLMCGICAAYSIVFYILSKKN